MRERDIEQYLIKRVRELGGEVRKVQWIGRAGAPDRFVLLPHWKSECKGKAFFIELKAPGQRPTDAQLREHARMRQCGMQVAVVDSKAGVDEVLW